MPTNSKVFLPRFMIMQEMYLVSFKPRKNITVFVNITDRKTRVSGDAQNVCAITIVGTALKCGRPSYDSYYLKHVCPVVFDPRLCFWPE